MQKYIGNIFDEEESENKENANDVAIQYSACILDGCVWNFCLIN